MSRELWAVSCELWAVRCKLSAASGKLQVVHLHLHLHLHFYLDLQVTLRATPGQLVRNFTFKLLKKLSQRLRAKQLSAQLWGNCTDCAAIKRSRTRPAAVECKWVAVRRRTDDGRPSSCYGTENIFWHWLAAAFYCRCLRLCFCLMSCARFAWHLFIFMLCAFLSQLLLPFLLMRNCW